MDANTNTDPWAGPIDYERITGMATWARPAKTLISMAPKNDPFYILPSRVKKAEWFSHLWRQHCEGRRDSQGRPSIMHIRGIHYVLISLKDRPNREGSAKAYENTERCFKESDEASRDARLLGLVPIDRIDDQRNDEPVEYLPNYASDDRPSVSLRVEEGREPEADVAPSKTIVGQTPSLFSEQPIDRMYLLGLSSAPKQLKMPKEVEAPSVPEMEVGFRFKELIPPSISTYPPRITPPWFHIELWCEKTTMNDILLELARERQLNLITGPGFQSLTGCWRFIKRARRSRRPVRILYISDFDKHGRDMPPSVARTIEFLLHKENLDLDIKLFPVALTHEQCVQYQLPRMPIKDSVGGKRAFEERFGGGATELDALETLHPGVLRRILLAEINRYSDPTFPARMEQVHERLKDELHRIHSGIVAPHREELDDLISRPQGLVDERNAEVESYVTEKVAALNARIVEIASGPVRSINERLADVKEQVDAINREIYRQFGHRIAPLNDVLDEARAEAEAVNTQVRRVGIEGIAEINSGIRDIDARCEAELSDVKERIGEINGEIQGKLETATEYVLDSVEWPKPEEDASAVPLFDSKRSYLEQMDFYKGHQGKAKARVIRSDKGSNRKRILTPRQSPALHQVRAVKPGPGGDV
jgi:tetrahydromethanopterin S-methyltransferase subunit G